jgi:hypothetical protein
VSFQRIYILLIGVALFSSALLSQQAVTLTSDGSSTTTSVTPAQAPITITLPTPTAIITAQLTSQPTTIYLPIEVVGPAGTTSAATFVLSTVPTGPLQLWLQVHNLNYDAQASVQVDNSVWLPISTANVTVQGNCAQFGGIGGGCNTLSLAMALPANTVTAGLNTITFRFNGTDGIRSGFRVLGFNVQTSSGANLIASSTFAQTNPATWVAPLNDASDIAVGLTLWQSAALTDPASGASVPIKAHCSDCHSIDGRDLKYFNYSNQSIEARSVFHGLSAQQGAQIASYIRSLSFPAPGSPWNPPYQPGPGIDSAPVSSWAAGTGLSSGLPNDAAMLPFLQPGGSSAGWAATAYLNTRQLPVQFQFPDWNHWLPIVSPMDSFPTFLPSKAYTDYVQLRTQLAPGTAAAYANAVVGTFNNWFGDTQAFLVPLQTGVTWTPTYANEIAGIAHWKLVKQWELNQDFGLESMASAIYGAKANPRGWFGNQAFMTAVGMLHIPSGMTANLTTAAWQYFDYVWYQLQLVLNDGQGKQSASSPIDYGYAEAGPKDLSLTTGNSPQASLELMWLVKALQENTLIGTGPQGGYLFGFQPTATDPFPLVNGGWETDWTSYASAQRVSLTTAFVQTWFAQIQTYTVAQFYAGSDGAGRPWASATENPATDNSNNTFGGRLWFTLPRLRFVGVSSALTTQIAAWAVKLFPGGNWAVNNAVVCVTINNCPNAQLQ